MTAISKLASSAMLLVFASWLGVAYAGAPEAAHMPGKPFLMLGKYDLAALGYAVEEFSLKGTAVSYKQKAGSSLDAEPAQAAPYVTRIVVVRPTDAEKFNGTVVVEWLNVSGGVDAAVDWTTVHREIMRSGFAYVAVSAQRVGVEGGASAMGGPSYALKTVNRDRYGQLSHPGDAFAFDIYSQAGRVLRGADASRVLGGLTARRLIAVGESQSAVFLTTYVNAVDPIAKVYDGFLIHSRFGSAAPLDGAARANAAANSQQSPVKLRDDLRAPVITVVTETDVLGSRRLGFYSARQPDAERLRIWEIAGAAHADTYLLTAGAVDSGSTPIMELAAALAPTREHRGGTLEKPINAGPQQHYVMQAALHHLNRWISNGDAPPHGTPLKAAEGEPLRFALDANGNAEGGVRSPWVDAPTMRLSGVGSSGSLFAQLVGSSEPFDEKTLARLYPDGRREYLEKFERSLASAIEAGFILAADRQEILELARASWPVAN